MTGHHDKSSELDRRASMRRSIRYSTASAVADDDDDDDDYDMMAMGISDGFRPTNVSQQHADNPFNDPSDYEPTPAPAPAPAPTPPQRPSSISKPRRQQDSFSLRHDGGMGQLNNNPPLARTTSSSSSASDASVIRPESPYQGPSGPSFPYQMYPQDVRLARTASLATTSTAPISERSYNGPRGPTHPYQMYPQNTVSAAEVAEDRPAPAAIPVGFPGVRDNYQRRLGPDGEEIADMIGPDGHTEQLPPYTRYPDEAYARKALAVEAAATAAAASAPAPPQSPPPQAPTLSTPAVAGASTGAVAGVAGLGAAPGIRDPELGTAEDSHLNNSPISRHSVRSFQSQSSVSQHDPSAAAMGPQMEEKQQPELTGWQRAAKRKVWGVVPCWAIALTAIVLAMLAIVLGAILGTFFGKHGGVGPSLPGSSGDSSPSITIDAVPLPTVPPGLLPLAEGGYNLPLTLTRSPSTCFNDTTQAQAWNCNIIPYSLLSLDIKFLPGEPATSQYSASISFNKSYTLGNNVFQYGMQPPEIQDVQLILVNDTYETSRGPAWAFELPYNKTVVIPESFFPTASSSSVVPAASETGVSKRSHVGLNSRSSSSSDFDVSFKRKGLARPGDKPWICHWGGTILETFIYAAQNSSRNPIVTSSSASMSASTTSSADASAATQDPYNPNAARAFPPPGFTGPSPADDDVTETATSTVTMTSTTDPFAAPTPSSSSYWKSSYPRVVKVEERRMAGPPSRAPYCRQYELDENGGAKAVRDKDGKVVELTIAEEETSYSSTFSTKPRIRRRDIEEYLGHSLDARDVGSDMSNCGCMWWLT